MALSGWFCTRSTKNMLVKIVHPGGHVELHDRPVLAAEIMLRNPRCCVTHPHVFQQPWAIVAPDTTLMLGKKFYVVPISTIRKLQRLSLKHSSSPKQEFVTGQIHSEEDEDGKVSACWLCVNNYTPKPPYACLKQPDDKKTSDTNDNCFMCLIVGNKIKASGEDSSDEARSSTVGSSETMELTRKRSKDSARTRSPKRRLSFDHWQPNLESINEESVD